MSKRSSEFDDKHICPANGGITQVDGTTVLKVIQVILHPISLRCLRESSL
jgi:hypothetical protein